MQLASATWTGEGYPTAYLAALPMLLADLTEGAAAFITDPRHFDPYSEHAVKDLEVEKIAILDAHARLTVPRLSICYEGVTGFAITTDPDHMRAPIGSPSRRSG